MLNSVNRYNKHIVFPVFSLLFGHLWLLRNLRLDTWDSCFGTVEVSDFNLR